MIDWLRARGFDVRGCRLCRGKEPWRQPGRAGQRQGPLHAEAPQSSMNKMRELGFEVFEPDMSMFTLGGGGVHCLCQALRRKSGLAFLRRPGRCYAAVPPRLFSAGRPRLTEQTNPPARPARDHQSMMDALYWWGVPTLFRAPHDPDPSACDIALVGVPHSTGNGTTERDQHLGPRAVRDISANGRRVHLGFRAGPLAGLPNSRLGRRAAARSQR